MKVFREHSRTFTPVERMPADFVRRTPFHFMGKIAWTSVQCFMDCRHETLHGSPWTTSMNCVIRGLPWTFMEFHGLARKLAWNSMEVREPFRASERNSMEFHEMFREKLYCT